MNKSSKHSASRKASSTSKSALGGLVGGTVATAILHPLDVLKLRQAVHGNSQNLAVRKSYSTMRGAFFEIKRAEGGSWLRGAYSGVGINCAAGGFGWATYFCGYVCQFSLLKQFLVKLP